MMTNGHWTSGSWALTSELSVSTSCDVFCLCVPLVWPSLYYHRIALDGSCCVTDRRRGLPTQHYCWSVADHCTVFSCCIQLLKRGKNKPWDWDLLTGDSERKIISWFFKIWSLHLVLTRLKHQPRNSGNSCVRRPCQLPTRAAWLYCATGNCGNTGTSPSSVPNGIAGTTTCLLPWRCKRMMLSTTTWWRTYFWGILWNLPKKKKSSVWTQ